MRRRVIATAAAALVAVLVAAGAVVAQTAQRFEDVPPDHYAFEAVEWAAEAELTTGYGDGTFKPQRPLNKRHAVVFMERFYDEILQAEESKNFTRGDMMVLLKAINDADIAPEDPDTEHTVVAETAQRFEDVPPDHYAFEAVEWAAEAELTTGYGDGTFKPQRPLNKRHAVVFMERFYDEILQAEESKNFTRGDMMVLLKAINDADINDGASTGPLIYNDNLFVLPVSEDFVVDGVASFLPLEEYTKRFYEHFEDNFDFLFVASNLVRSGDMLGVSYYISVKNDVQGIGEPLFSDTGRWGSRGRLQGVIGLPFVALAEDPEWLEAREWTPFGGGPGLHEVMHRWANFIWPAGAHWGFSSANGLLGGFDIALLEDHGSGRYTAGWFNTDGTSDLPFSPIELYLAGLAPPEEVPDLWVAEDGEWLLDGLGNRRLASNGYPLFTASRIRTLTIEDIIAEHGQRIPAVNRSQKDFRAAVILLVNEDHPANLQVLKRLSEAISWVSAPAFTTEGDNYNVRTTNFYESANGQATITMDGLAESRKNEK